MEAKNKKKKTSLNLTLKVLRLSGKTKEDISLNKNIFDGKVSPALLQQAVNTYLANKRKGLAVAKTKGEKRGGGKKPWRQKGTGRARVGSIRSPLWKGGGVTFGPRPKSYNKKFPERMKAMAFKSALNAKLKDNQIMVVDKMNTESPKTKEFAKIMANLGVAGKKVCFVLPDSDQNLEKASANIRKVKLAKADSLNALDVLDCRRLVISQGALGIIEKRLKKWL
ncbi:MAG: 50S ribosomal protein L4 [Candidatus Omnitrophica bacterium]|nr:50S ribosomal protein L4 [Candidatus Omnitrophota bacterium]MCF7876904.1 50S ribosomal protein L4 [Candidatus Omnitrophota bacterium]MCF7878032.1 50S ribosomal protein L4 [Candidatus Omnitrophota bacterium]MCF7893204.1 50S ribosomal protein L4 [Candidatus Omnitrophota bacterium]